MGTICLSLAVTLRCQTLSRFEDGILLLPAGLVAIFAASLIVIKWGTGRKHYLLAGEGLIYFFIALLDMLTHFIPAARTSLHVFRALDIVVGVASFFPLLFYTLYLFIFTTSDILPTLPFRFQAISKFTFLAFIPVILVASELGSFVGIRYRKFQTGLAVGFGPHDAAHTFLDSLTLALLTAYQALAFCAVFCRLVKAFIDQRRIESEGRAEHQVHLFRGLGWIACGLKLGAIETIIGFAQGGFGLALTRRVLLFLGRAFLIIGIVKGVDTVEDFNLFNTNVDIHQRRHSAFRALISNPRNSTFRQIDGHNFNIAQPRAISPAMSERAARFPSFIANSAPASPIRTESPPIISPPMQMRTRTRSPVPTTPPYLGRMDSQQRVTVQLGRGRAPTLVLQRFSDLNMPSPLRANMRSPSPVHNQREPGEDIHRVFVQSPLSRVSTASSLPTPAPVRQTINGPNVSQRTANSTYPRVKAKLKYLSTSTQSTTLSSAKSYLSSSSEYSQSVETVRHMTALLPPLPPRISAVPHDGNFLVSSSWATQDSGAPPTELVHRSSSIKRKPVPRFSVQPDVPIQPDVPMQTIVPEPAIPSPAITNSKLVDEFNTGRYTHAHKRSMSLNQMIGLPTPTSMDSSTLFAYRMDTSPSSQDSPRQDITQERRHTMSPTSNRPHSESESLDERSRSSIVRIKSVGRAPLRYTPTPTHDYFKHGSVAIDPVEWRESGTTDVGLGGRLRLGSISSIASDRLKQAFEFGSKRDSRVTAGDSFLDC